MQHYKKNCYIHITIIWKKGSRCWYNFISHTSNMSDSAKDCYTTHNIIVWVVQNSPLTHGPSSFQMVQFKYLKIKKIGLSDSMLKVNKLGCIHESFSQHMISSLSLSLFLFLGFFFFFFSVISFSSSSIVSLIPCVDISIKISTYQFNKSSKINLILKMITLDSTYLPKIIIKIIRGASHVHMQLRDDTIKSLWTTGNIYQYCA